MHRNHCGNTRAGRPRSEPSVDIAPFLGCHGNGRSASTCGPRCRRTTLSKRGSRIVGTTSRRFQIGSHDVVVSGDERDCSEPGPIADEPALEKVDLLVAFEECACRVRDRGIPVVDLEDGVDEFSAGWSSAMLVPPRESEQAGSVCGRGARRLFDRSQERAQVGVLRGGRERFVAILNDAHRGRMPYQLGIPVLGSRSSYRPAVVGSHWIVKVPAARASASASSRSA